MAKNVRSNSTEKLDQIEKDLKDAIKRRKDLKKELSDLSSDLAVKRRQQGADIVDSKAVTKLGGEIVKIQTQMEGIQEGITQLDNAIYDLESHKLMELRNIASANAEASKAKRLEIEKVIYGHLVAAAENYAELEKENILLGASLRSADVDKDEIRIELRNTNAVLQDLKAFPNLLEKFQGAIFVDTDLPKPDEIRDRMAVNNRKKVRRKSGQESALQILYAAEDNHYRRLVHTNDGDPEAHRGEFKTCKNKQCQSAHEAYDRSLQELIVNTSG